MKNHNKLSKIHHQIMKNHQLWKIHHQVMKNDNKLFKNPQIMRNHQLCKIYQISILVRESVD